MEKIINRQNTDRNITVDAKYPRRFPLTKGLLLIAGMSLLTLSACTPEKSGAIAGTATSVAPTIDIDPTLMTTAKSPELKNYGIIKRGESSIRVWAGAEIQKR